MPTFEDLKALRQWVVWKYETRDNKKTKVPYQVNGHRASSTDPATWTTWENANAKAVGGGDIAGVGFVFSADDAYCGIDFDKCLNDGVLEPWAEELLNLFLPTYAEVSPSGTGIKLWVIGELPLAPDGKKHHKKTGLSESGGAVEIYDADRFFTVTGQQYSSNTDIANRQDQLATLYAQLWPAPQGVSLNGHTHAAASVSLEDQKILDLARAARNGDKFARLWQGDTTMHAGDDSAADLALVSILAFYTQNVDQIDRLFRASGLMREKWNRKDYRDRTIGYALRSLKETYKQGSLEHFSDNFFYVAFDGPQTPPEPAGEQNMEVATTARPRSSTAAATPGKANETNETRVERFLSGPPPYKPFPLEVFPQAIADYCQAAANAKSVPVEYIALPLLSAMGAAIGITRQIEVKRDWREYPTIWTCILGRTGTNKSGAMSLASYVNRRKNKHAYEEWIEAQKKYEAELVEYEAAKKRKDTSVQKPEQPVPAQYVAGDTTIEALIMILKNNPRGLLVMNDELSAWFKSFGAYKQGRGGDREHWLSLYSSKEFQVNRKMGEAKYVHVDSAVICIAGGTQPSIINELLTKDLYESGMASRFIFCYPPEIPNHFNTDEVPDHLIEQLERYVGELFALRSSMDIYNKPVPKVIGLSTAAQHVWKVWHDENSREMMVMEDKYRAVWGKAPSHAARLALILHLLDQIDGQPWASVGEVEPSTVSRAHMLTDWMKHEQRRIYMSLAYTPEQQNAQTVIDQLIAFGGQCTLRDIYTAHFKFRDQQLLDETIALLEKTGIVHVTYEKPKPNGGRPARIVKLVAKPRDAKREWISD